MKNELTVDQVGEKSRNLKNEINKLLMAFSMETGCHIKNINLSPMTCDDNIIKRYGVKLDVRLTDKIEENK